MTESERWFADPNGPAYRTGEQRVGPPLDYVGEKLSNALGCQHGVLQGLARAAAAQPAERDAADAARRTPDGVPGAPSIETLHTAARIGFDYQLTAYLALYNMLGAKGGHEDVERLARLPPEEFRRWRTFVEREGSVTGA